jgi:hypothetical protein
MNKLPLVVLVCIVAGVALSIYSLGNLKMLGDSWYTTEDAFQVWSLAPFWVVPAHEALSTGGLLAMWLGGFFGGLGLALFHNRSCLIGFFACPIFTGLGFNTLDWMMAPIIASTGAAWQATWFFYFFQSVVPFWFGGFLISFSIIIFFRYS